VTKKVVEAMPNYDLVILNFANPDMVGHTGVVEAGIKDELRWPTCASEMSAEWQE
jgi:bisphosphoglycerate-independent phosphoglycerate mutase (AlkP superfamily)